MKKRGLLVVVLIAAMALLSGCGSKKESAYYVISGMELGTTYTIIVEESDTTGVQEQIDSLFEVASGSMSLYDPNSLISRVNRGETEQLDKHLEYCIKLAEGVSIMSGGIYDITVKPLSEAWGFLGKREESREPNVDSLMQYVGFAKISLSNGKLVRTVEGVQIDLNSIAKGYIVDLMGELMERRGAENYMVEIGGELYCKGVNRRGESWLVGIDSPIDGNIVSGQKLQAKAQLTDRAMATSGNYRKFYQDEQGRKVAHILNPLTGRSEPSTLLSATVVAENCAIADALCTMLMAMGEEKAKEFVDKNPQYPIYLVVDGKGEEFDVYYNATFEELLVD